MIWTKEYFRILNIYREGYEREKYKFLIKKYIVIFVF